MDVRICDDVRPEHTQWFTADRFPEFAQIVSRHVATRRTEWHVNFGPVQFPARTHEVYETIILPRYESITGAGTGTQPACLLDPRPSEAGTITATTPSYDESRLARLRTVRKILSKYLYQFGGASPLIMRVETTRNLSA